MEVTGGEASREYAGLDRCSWACAVDWHAKDKSASRTQDSSSCFPVGFAGENPLHSKRSQDVTHCRVMVFVMLPLHSNMRVSQQRCRVNCHVWFRSLSNAEVQ